MFKNKTKQKIEQYINDLKLYLENNYKDLAIKARKEGIEALEAAYASGEIKEKDYRRYRLVLDTYTEEMKDYNHQQFYRT